MSSTRGRKNPPKDVVLACSTPEPSSVLDKTQPRKPKAILCDWYLKRENSSTWMVQLVGWNKDSVQRPNGKVDVSQLTTTVITNRIDSNSVASRSGSLFRLDGRVDQREMHLQGFGDYTIAAFSDGFPVDWEHVLEDDWRQHEGKENVQAVCVSSELAELDTFLLKRLPASEKLKNPPRVPKGKKALLSGHQPFVGADRSEKAADAGEDVEPTRESHSRSLRPRNANGLCKNVQTLPARLPKVPQLKVQTELGTKIANIQSARQSVGRTVLLDRKSHTSRLFPCPVKSRTANCQKISGMKRKTLAASATRTVIDKAAAKHTQLLEPQTSANDAKSGTSSQTSTVKNNMSAKKQPVKKVVPPKKPTTEPPKKRTVKWFSGAILESVQAVEQQKKHVGFNLVPTGITVVEEVGELADADWEDLDLETFEPVTFTDTTRTFRMSMGRRWHQKPLHVVEYEPSNQQAAAERLNFDGFMLHDQQQKLKRPKEHSFSEQAVLIGKTTEKPIIAAVPLLPKEIREAGVEYSDEDAYGLLYPE